MLCELIENLFWEPELHVHPLTYTQACLSQTVLQSLSLFVGVLYSSHQLRDGEESTAHSPWVKTSCPWKQPEEKWLPLVATVVYPVEVPAVGDRRLRCRRGEKAHQLIPTFRQLLLSVLSTWFWWCSLCVALHSFTGKSHQGDILIALSRTPSAAFHRVFLLGVSELPVWWCYFSAVISSSFTVTSCLAPDSLLGSPPPSGLALTVANIFAYNNHRNKTVFYFRNIFPCIWRPSVHLTPLPSMELSRPVVTDGN